MKQLRETTCVEYAQELVFTVKNFNVVDGRPINREHAGLLRCFYVCVLVRPMTIERYYTRPESDSYLAVIFTRRLVQFLYSLILLVLENRDFDFDVLHVISWFQICNICQLTAYVNFHRGMLLNTELSTVVMCHLTYEAIFTLG